MKKGFTLVELIAIITIIGIMAVLILPQISSDISSRKESQYNNIVKTIESAAKVYYADNQTATIVYLNTLISEDYISSGLINPVTEEAMDGCILFTRDSEGYNQYNYYEDCESFVSRTITLDLNGGTSTQTLNSDYYQGNSISLITPTKSGYIFSGWSVTCTSCLSGNVYIVGDADDIIIANWSSNIQISLNLNGGTTTQTLNASYATGNVINLVSPTKVDYTFNNWSSTCVDCLSGSTYTVGTNNDTIVANWIITTNDFDYTGGVQTFVVGKTGYYKLETWGARGGGSGGYGAYSVGVVNLTSGTTLYIYVGGTTNISTGGYNGGGSITGNVYGGGGATHIATVSGLLNTLSSNQSAILIVSSGGGGVGNGYAGGNAGGILGGNGTGDDYGRGGTQTAGGGVTSTGCGATVGGFGYGGSASWVNEPIGGGGGGFYGGGSGGGTNNNGSGGGGSSYIANSLLLTYGGVTKAMYCYNCTTSSTDSTLTYSTTNQSATATSNYAKSGNGYARITYMNS